jgi:hypothetical protein
VCCYVEELVQREPGMIAAAKWAVGCDAGAHGEDGAGAHGEDGASTGGSRGSGDGKKGSKSRRYLIAADRCYCLISRVPFFSLHFEVLHAMLGMERLERIRACVEEMMSLDDDDHGCSEGEEEADRDRPAAAAAEVRLLPIRPRSRGARRSLRTFPVVTLHPRFPFNV